MPFPLMEALEIAEALFPISGQGIPHKAQGIEPDPTLGRHGVVPLAAIADPGT